jgi:hypothetical protein
MKTTNIQTNDPRTRELEEKIADLKKRWPAHSVPPALMQELDDLEEELARAVEQAQQDEANA